MKKIILSIVAYTIVLTSFSQINVGLVAHYSFNDQTAIDNSGNNNDGTEFKTGTSDDRFGNANHAFSFDGDSSVVLMPDSLLINSSLSISLWFRTISLGGLIGHQVNEIFQTSNSYVPILYIREDSILNATFWQGFVDNMNEDSTTIMNDDEWHHVVINADEIDQEIYIDNVLKGTGTGMNIITSMIHNQIGAARSAGAWPSSTANDLLPFEGDIDDVRIYHKLLNTNEIDSLYNEENPITPPPSGFTKKTSQLLQVYPNPTNGRIQIKTSEKIKSVDVLDVTGRTVLNSNRNTINISSFNSGIYFLEVTTEEGTYVKKIIKE